jgi:hypothetical protein
VAGTPFDEAGPLDGVVGRFGSADDSPSIAQPERVLVVSVAGAISGRDATALAADVELLLHELSERRPDGSAEGDRTTEIPAISADEDIAVALHGLTLDPDLEAELHHAILAQVRGRLARWEVGE